MSNENAPSGTPAAPAANAGAGGSGPAAGEGGAAGDGQSGIPAPGSEAGEAGAGGAGGEPLVTDPPKPAGEGGEGADGKAADGKEGDTPTELVLPEGVEVSAEWRAELTTLSETIDKLPPLARQQAIVDAGIKFRAEIEAQLAGDTNERIAQWAVDAKADPVIGGANFDQNLMVAQTAFAKYGDPELKYFLVDSGLGNHPALLRWAYKVGKADSEHQGVSGLGREVPPPPANSEAAQAERMAAAASKPTRKQLPTPTT